MKTYNFKIKPGFYVATGILTVIILISCVQKESQKGKDENLNQDYDVAAYIWPSCHHDERFGDMLWPEG
ncbi:MAG: hypothetical protein V5A47_03265, partial [Bacteroidales bacterium]